VGVEEDCGGGERWALGCGYKALVMMEWKRRRHGSISV